jgi:hypothetical protein
MPANIGDVLDGCSNADHLRVVLSHSRRILLVSTTHLLELPTSWFFAGLTQQLAGEVSSTEPAAAEVVEVARALVGTASHTGANENNND